MMAAGRRRGSGMARPTRKDSAPKRRDFLAGLSAAPLAGLWPARAAFAQNAPSVPPADTRIARIAVYPPMGICRVGNSGEWFLAPEVPGLPAVPDGRYKDDRQRVKKQVQRSASMPSTRPDKWCAR